MAREEQTREELLREATALIERIEFHCPMGGDAHYVAGFRTNGAFSLYCGEDPVFQFNDQGEFRRGFWRGDLLKAEQRAVVRMRRTRQENEVQLVRLALTADEIAEIFAELQSRLTAVAEAIRGGRLAVVGQVPADVPILPRVLAWIDHQLFPVPIAVQPSCRVTAGPTVGS